MKKIVTLITALLTVFAFAACTSSPISTADNDREGTAETEAALNEAPTDEPTEDPTPNPTEAPSLSEAPLPENPDDIADSIKDAEVLLYLPYDGENFGFLEPDEEAGLDRLLGPRDFVVANDRIYILDALNDRVAVWDGTALTYIPYERPDRQSYASLIAVVGNTVYVGYNAQSIGRIIGIDASGNAVEDPPLPEGDEDGLDGLYDSDGRLCMYDYALNYFELIDGRFVRSFGIDCEPLASPVYTATFDDGRVFNIDAGFNSLAGIRRVVNDRLYCEVLEFDPDAIALEMEISYRVYDMYGNMLGATTIDREDTLTREGAIMYVSPEGEMYIMMCAKDGLYVTKPNLRADYTPHFTGPTNG